MIGSRPLPCSRRRGSRPRARPLATRRPTPPPAAGPTTLGSFASLMTDAAIGASGSLSQRSDNPDRRPHAPRPTRSPSAFSDRRRRHRIESRPASTARGVSSASPAPTRRASRAPGVTDVSRRSTSRRCAVSRHQPFGCDSVATSCLRRRRRQRRLRTAPRRSRSVDDAPDAPVAHRHQSSFVLM